MDPKLAAYSARKIIEAFSRDPKMDPALKKILEDLLGADTKTFTHAKVYAQIRVTALDDALEKKLNGGVDADLVTIVDATGKRRALLLI